jgi:integrase
MNAAESTDLAPSPAAETPSAAGDESTALAIVEPVSPGREAIVAFRRGDEPSPDVGRRAVTVYLETLRSDESRATVRACLKRVATALDRDTSEWETLPWHMLTADGGTRARAALLETYGPTTARTTLSILRSVLRTAWRLGQIDGDRFERVTSWGPVKGESPIRGRELSKEEIGQLRAWCDRQPAFYGALAWGMIASALGAGLRRIEIVRLRVADLADDSRHLLIHGKGSKVVVHPIDAWVGASLESWIAQRSRVPFAHSAMFSYATPQRVRQAQISKWQVWKLLQEVGDGAKLAHFTPHDLRRTYVTAFLRKRGDLSMAKNLARHANEATTARYDMRKKEEIAEAAEVVGAEWFGEASSSDRRRPGS